MTNDKATCAKRIAVSMALVFGLSTPALPIQAQVPQSSQQARLLVSASPHAIPADISGTARLLIHDMPSTQGGITRASTLLFVPNGTAPAGGWPIVA